MLGWWIFGILIAIGLFWDLWTTDHKPPSLKNSILFSVLWLSLGLLFGVGVWWFKGTDLGLQYFSGFLLEKSLALDNIFMFVMIFEFFQVKSNHTQHAILFWGVLGAILFRVVFMIIGVQLMKLSGIYIVLALILIVSGIQMWRMSQHQGKNHEMLFKLMKWLKKSVPICEQTEKFFTKTPEGWRLGINILPLLVIEIVDIVFALDSVPLILAVSQDLFILITSNVFAILGLRSLFFLTSYLTNRFELLKYGISFILIFGGVKMFLSHSQYALPHMFSLSVILVVLLLSVVLSIWQKPKSSQ